MTPEQIQQFRERAKTQLGFSDAQVDSYLRSKGVSVAKAAPTNRNFEGVSDSVKESYKLALTGGLMPNDISKGVLKGIGSTLSNLEGLGKKALGTISSPIVKGITGKPYQPSPTIKETFGDKLKPNNLSEKIGFTGEQVGEYFLPGAAGIKATKGMGLAAKVGAEALGTGIVSTAQGNDLKNVATMSGIAGAIPIVGKLSSIAATPVKKFLSEKISSALLNKYILRPVAKDFHFGKDPGLGVAKEGLTANTREGLLKEIQKRIKLIGNQVDDVLRNADPATKISVNSALKGLDKKIAKAAGEGEEVLYNRLVKFREGLTSKFKIIEGKAVKVGDRPLQLTALEANQLKRSIGKSFKWTGQAFDAEVNQAKVEVYRALNEMIDKSVPGTRALNQRWANLLTAEKALENTINVAKRQMPIGLIDSGISSAVGLGSLATGTGTVGALINGLITATGLKAFKSTAVQSRLAARLVQMTPEQQTTISKAVPLLRNLLFGIISSDGGESDQQQSPEKLGE